MKNFFYYLFLAILSLLLLACDSHTPQLKRLNSQDVIVAFGDSLTYGTGATPETSYPADLEKIIGIKVINAGVPGEETSAGLERISSVLEAYHPKLVILCLGGNDQIRKRKPEQIKQNLKSIIQRIQQSGAGVLLVAVPMPVFRLGVPELYQALGEEFNIPVMEDSLADLLKQPSMKTDSIHLNAAGYQAFAEAIADMLRKAGAIPPP